MTTWLKLVELLMTYDTYQLLNEEKGMIFFLGGGELLTRRSECSDVVGLYIEGRRGNIIYYILLHILLNAKLT